MMRRQAMYKPEEAASLARYRENDPACQLQAAVAAAVSEAESAARTDAREGA
jgi:hypothetical protein